MWAGNPRLVPSLLAACLRRRGALRCASLLLYLPLQSLQLFVFPPLPIPSCPSFLGRTLRACVRVLQHPPTSGSQAPRSLCCRPSPRLAVWLTHLHSFQKPQSPRSLCPCSQLPSIQASGHSRAGPLGHLPFPPSILWPRLPGGIGVVNSNWGGCHIIAFTRCNSHAIKLTCFAGTTPAVLVSLQIPVTIAVPLQP